MVPYFLNESVLLHSFPFSLLLFSNPEGQIPKSDVQSPDQFVPAEDP